MLKNNPFFRVQILRQKFNTSLGLPFQSLLPESTLQEVLNDEKIKYRQRLFDPFVTLWAFLSQVLHADKTCHNAVSRVIAWLASVDIEISSEDISTYCQARKRLPEKLLQKVFGNKFKSHESLLNVLHKVCIHAAIL